MTGDTGHGIRTSGKKNETPPKSLKRNMPKRNLCLSTLKAGDYLTST